MLPPPSEKYGSTYPTLVPRQRQVKEKAFNQKGVSVTGHMLDTTWMDLPVCDCDYDSLPSKHAHGLCLAFWEGQSVCTVCISRADAGQRYRDSSSSQQGLCSCSTKLPQLMTCPLLTLLSAQSLPGSRQRGCVWESVNI